MKEKLLMNDAFWRFLGLAYRAGRVATGSDALEMGIRAGRVVLAILSDDAGPNTKDKINRLCIHYSIPMIEAGDRLTLGHWTGKQERVAIGVTDQGFAKRLAELAAQ
jgi:ribosomal protein L7Ae-like RNA K-turn-binding protein